MSKRLIFSIILILLAIGSALLIRGKLGETVASFFLIAMLFVWVFPAGLFESGNRKKSDPAFRRVLQAFLGVGLGLLAAVTAALLLPPQIFSWVIMAVGLIMIVWIVVRMFR